MLDERGELSERETQVLALVAQGYRDAQIGQKLSISLRTVNHHVGRILEKLGAANRAEAVAIAFSRGIITGQ